MGKKTRKTRWRTLSIADDGSDSTESSTNKTQRLPKSYQQKSFYDKFAYSSQSTPRRRYQYDTIKSTRSSSTASENKITFNEDEYTKITTPRQDVLFKKGYLNKPRNYQTQTSTGTSTTSTGNSTGNGTPDYQSTDLEYESQFVFPNGFVDQNGIYYLNGFDSYPLMFYNMPTYYPEYSAHKLKRQSSGSLAESVSADTEEATSQEPKCTETSNNLSDYSGHQGIYNVIYPGYCINGFDPCHEMMSGHYHTDPLKRIKKRKRMKSSTSHTSQDSTECSDGQSEGYEEEREDAIDYEESNTEKVETPEENNAEQQETRICEEDPIIDINPNNKLDTTNDTSPNSTEPSVSDVQTEATHDNTLSKTEPLQGDDEVQTLECSKPFKYDLKPDAKEFVPKAYNHSEIPFSSVQFIKVSPNFIPVPLIPINNQNFNPSLIPSGIPVNFVPPDPKMFVSFLQNSLIPKNVEVEKDPLVTNQLSISNCDNSNTATNVQFTKAAEDAIETKINNNNPIDIAMIVSKLEEAAKQQKAEEWNKKSFKKTEQHIMNYKKHVCNNLQSTPQPEQFCKRSPLKKIESTDKISNNTTGLVNNNIYKTELPSKMKSNIDRQNSRYIRNTPDKYKKDRKLPYQNNFNKRYSKEERNFTPQTKDKISSGNRIQQKNDDSSMEKIEPNESNIKFISAVNKPTDNWISVCSKKRKRNKGAEETLECEKEQDCNQSDELETSDTNLIVQIDVEMNNNSETKEIKEEDISISTTQTENGQPDTSECSRLEIKHVHIEKDSTEDNESDEVPHKLQGEPANNVENLVESVCSEYDSKLNTASDKVNKKNNKNNSTRRKQKTTTKRVIITDIDLSEKPKEIKSSSTNNVTTEEKITLVETKSKDVPANLLKPEVKPSIPQIDEQYCSSELGVNDEDKKKSKKKKKKSAKLCVSNASIDDSPLHSSTLNDSGDTFEFLDSGFAGELQEKTNDEIYQELDKIIQRGMYNNLEEKIKSLNINEGDGFFKSMFSKVSFREKPPEFNEFLQTAQTVGKPNLKTLLAWRF